jgi:hypothetical protein
MNKVYEIDNNKTPFRKQLHWMIKSPPSHAARMTVTPEMASIMLEHNSLSRKNRSIRKTRVKKFVIEIQKGRWRLVTTGIGFDTDGNLTNGQHRLTAVIESGIPCEFFVAFGLSPESFNNEDAHGIRTAQDIFTINGVIDPALIAAAVAWIYRYNAMGMSRFDSDKYLTKEDQYEYYMGLSGDLHESRKFGVRFNKGNLAPPSLMVALHYLCTDKHHVQADDFFTKVATGVGVTSTKDPAHKLRGFLLNNLIGHNRVSSEALAAFTVQAWNAMREHRHIAIFRWRGEQNPNQPFPKIK